MKGIRIAVIGGTLIWILIIWGVSSCLSGCKANKYSHHYQKAKTR